LEVEEVGVVEVSPVETRATKAKKVTKAREEEEAVAGPSHVEPKAKKSRKGKGKEVVAEEELRTSLEDLALRRETIARKLATKRVELEILVKEIEVLEEMLEM
jgi:hypothetical protein